MIRIIWSPQSIEDIQAIQRFISRDSPRFGSLVAGNLVDAVERLASFPESGRVVPELSDAMIREILWRDYRIVYRLGTTTVEIVTVFHGSRTLRTSALSRRRD